MFVLVVVAIVVPLVVAIILVVVVVVVAVLLLLTVKVIAPDAADVDCISAVSHVATKVCVWCWFVHCFCV